MLFGDYKVNLSKSTEIYRLLCLPKSMNKSTIATVRIKLIKVAGKVINTVRYTTFKLCSSCLYKKQEKDQLHELENTLDTTRNYTEVVDNNRENYLATVENFKSDVLLQVNADIESTEQQVEQLEKELILLEDQMKSYIVTAPIDGKVNIRTNISKGDYLQAGTEVLTIVPQAKESTFTVQLSILNQDIANTAIGDKVKLRIHSLPYQEYGQLEGEITRISTDAINDPETGFSYYLAEAIIDQDELVSYKGVPGHIKVGMTTDAHIVSESKKILHFLLEKIDLRD